MRVRLEQNSLTKLSSTEISQVLCTGSCTGCWDGTTSGRASFNLALKWGKLSVAEVAKLNRLKRQV